MAPHLALKSFESAVFRGVEAAVLFLMHVVLSRALSTHDFGLISYSLFLLNVVGLIAPIGFTTSALRFVAQYREAGQYLALKGFVLRAAQLTSLVSIACAVAMIVCAEAWLREQPYYYGVIWAALLLPVVALGQVRRKVAEGAGWIRGGVTPDLIPPLLVILAVTALGTITLELAFEFYLAATAAGLVVGFFVIFRYLSKVTGGAAAQYQSRNWILVSAPMMAAGLGSVLMNRIDVLVLGVYSDMSTVGHYTAASRVALLTAFFLNAVYVVVAPRLSVAFGSGHHQQFISQLRHATVMATLGSLAIAIPLMLWPTSILGIFGEEYKVGGTVLIILALTQCIHAVLGVGAIALTLTGQQNAHAWTVLGGVVLTLLACTLAAPRWGGEGVAMAALFSTLLTKSVQVWLLSRALAISGKGGI